MLHALAARIVNYVLCKRDCSISGFGYVLKTWKLDTDIGLVKVLMSWSGHDEKQNETMKTETIDAQQRE